MRFIAAILLVLTPFVSTSFASAKTVKVGVILPLSGPLAAYGKSTYDGIKLGVDQANANSGNAYQIQLVVEDNKGDKSDTVAAYKKLTSVSRVSAVIGPITSTNALAVASRATREKIPTISPTATNDRVAPRSPYMFRACFNDSFQGLIVANYALSQKITKAAIITDLGSDYSKGLAASFKAAFVAGGGAVVEEQSYQQKDTEFGIQLSRIKSSGAETVFVPGYPPEVPLIIKQAGVIGLDASFCGADGWDHDDVISKSGKSVEGSFIVGAFSPDDTREAVTSFMTSFKNAYGRDAGTFEALGFDSVTLLDAAMASSGVSPSAIQRGLLAIDNVETVTGKTKINTSGDAIKSAVVLGIVKQDDKYVKKYLATVNP